MATKTQPAKKTRKTRKTTRSAQPTPLHQTTGSPPQAPRKTTLPPARVAVPVMEGLLRERPGQAVVRRDLPDFYDAVLEALGVDPPTETYPRVVSHLHTLLCTECPRVCWTVLDKKQDVSGFVWTRQSLPTASPDGEQD